MANIQERRDKNGVLISYSIRVHRGRDSKGNQLKPYTATFEVSPTWTEKSARRKAEAYAAVFEKECKEGRACDTRQRFSDYCDYVISLKDKVKAKHSTIVRYKELTQRIYPEIGHIKLKELRTDHLNSMYIKLLETQKKGSDKMQAKIDLDAVRKMKGKSYSAIARETGLAQSTVSVAIAGRKVTDTTAKAVSKALGLKVNEAFKLYAGEATLSKKTVLEHHRLVHTVLEQALKDRLIPYNPANMVTLPSAERKDVNYFQPDELDAIIEALKTEPIKWRAMLNLFIVTGARRGEILGLKWENVFFDRKRINICSNVLYSVEKGIYIDSPKTQRSRRAIALPEETVELLRQYKKWQDDEIERLGAFCEFQGYVFCQPNGKPMHPDSVNDWMAKFSERHNLPHINPHAFRHTMASMLYRSNVDSVTISKRLGHAQVSTTANIYAHTINHADEESAEIIADVMLHHKS